MPIIVALLASLGAGVYSFTSGNEPDLAVALLRYLLLISNGVILFVTSLSHMLRPEFMARELGWAPGGPFQTVVGFWNFGVSIICLLAFFGGAEARTAATLVTAIFWAGAASLHWSAYLSGEGDRNRGLTAVGETVLVALLVGLLFATA